MLKIIKWSALGLLIISSAGYFVFGEHLGSYFSTIGNSVRENVRGKIPVEFEIRRAEKLIQAIDPEIKECKREVAQAEVELEHLVAQVDRLEGTTAKQERRLKNGCNVLGDAECASSEIAGRLYPRQRVEIDLARTFEVYKNNKAILKSKKALIQRQTMAVGASRAKLDSVRARQAELENTIATLKVQKQHLDALAASSRRFDLDESALSQATEVLSEVKTRLDVAQRMIEDDLFFAEGIQDESVPHRNILEEISAHFAAANAGEVAAPTRVESH